MSRELGHRGLTELHVVETMHERKQMMAERSDAFVALPGGIGTFEELFEVWTWRQLGYHDKPVGLLNVDGYYDALLGFLSDSERKGFVPRDAARAAAGRDRPVDAARSARALAARATRPTTTAGSEADLKKPAIAGRARAALRVRPRLRRSRRCGCAPPARPR